MIIVFKFKNVLSQQKNYNLTTNEDEESERDSQIYQGAKLYIANWHTLWSCDHDFFMPRIMERND